MTFYIKLRPTIVAKHLQACSGQRAQPAQAGGYPYILKRIHGFLGFRNKIQRISDYPVKEF